MNIDDIDFIGQKTMIDNKLFSVSWILSRYCPYSCSYCWDYAHSPKKDHRPLEQLISVVEQIRSQASNAGFENFHFSFSGGEPTSQPNYLDLLEHISRFEQYNSLHMTTNLMPGLGWWDKYIERTILSNRVTLTASWHYEFAKKEDFVTKLQFLDSNGIGTVINIVMAPNVFEQQYDIAKYFIDNGLNVTLKPQSNETATQIKEYTVDQLNILRTPIKLKANKAFIDRLSVKKQLIDYTETDQIEVRSDNILYSLPQAEFLNNIGLNGFKGWKCSAGHSSIIIREPGGEIKRGYSCMDLPLGTIDSGFNLNKTWLPCITNRCVSSADSKLPKTKY